LSFRRRINESEQVLTPTGERFMEVQQLTGAPGQSVGARPANLPGIKRMVVASGKGGVGKFDRVSVSLPAR